MGSLRREINAINKMDLFNYYGDFLLLPIIIGIDVHYVLKDSQIDLSTTFVFVIGLIIYGSLIEYGFHRYLYHGRIKKITTLHLLHHKVPKSYVSSPPYVTASILIALHILVINLLGIKLGCAFLAGIASGYLWYITIHHLIHHMSYPDSKLLNYFKREHDDHHHHAKINYCVSQPFWNKIFRKRK